jgi:hypothetical protein
MLPAFKPDRGVSPDFGPQRYNEIVNPGGDFVWHFEWRQMARPRDDLHLRVIESRAN